MRLMDPSQFHLSAKSTLNGVIAPGFGTLSTLSEALSAASVQQGNQSISRTIVLVGDTDLISTTLEIDLAGAGASDKLAVEGVLKLGGILRLRGVDVTNAALTATPHTIITCSEGCSGAFDSIEAPQGYTASVDVQENAVLVTLSGGVSEHRLFLPTVVKVE